MLLRFWICLAVLGTSVNASTDEALSAAYNSTNARLISKLLERYKKNLRPVLHPIDPITVYIYGAPYQIVNVDQKRNLISLSAYFKMSWQDVYLRWRPEDYEYAEYVLLPVSEVWTPDVFVYYSSNENSVIQSVFNVKVNHTGHVQSFVPFRTETICPIDVKKFPFDEQHCVILFGTWPPNGDGIHLHIVEGGENLDAVDFYDSQEWTLENFSLLYDNGSYATGNTNIVAMHLHIARQWFYYVFNLVIPSALICLVSVVGFHLPSASTGGRLSKSRLGIMTLLSMSVLLLSIVNELPKFGFETVPGKKGSFSSIPLIGIYYFSLLAIISMATISSSWLVVLEKSVIRDGVPAYLQWLLVEEWPCWKGKYGRSSAAGKYKAARPSSPRKEPTEVSVLTVCHCLGSLYCSLLGRTPTALFCMFQFVNLNYGSPGGVVTPRALPDGQQVEGGGACGLHNDNTMEFYHDIQSLLTEAVAVLRDMRAVLAEPLSRSIHPHAGLVIKRLEWLCLIFYLVLVMMVLLMFFCWQGWYA